ncbi:MAG TPA: sigma factor [Candidatus Binatia bacterium]|jgi:DNA-directed RNA polymerase specialized sigma24 family protein|nr:sigma factor [Candidatus Binatia bacterium]
MRSDAPRTGFLSDDSAQGAGFSQTHWSTVLAAQGSSPTSTEALNRLCRRYWRPVYAFIRRKWTQHSPHKAEDLTQGFFAEFTRKLPELALSPEKGKFRTYLLACLTRFLCKDWDRSATKELLIPPEELEQAAGVGAWIPLGDCTAEYGFDVVWANTLAENALSSLREEYGSAGKAVLYDRLSPWLTGRAAEGVYATLATELQMSEGALRVATHQLRRRFGQLLRAEVANTIARQEDTEEELRYLLSLWGANRATSGEGR